MGVKLLSREITSLILR